MTSRHTKRLLALGFFVALGLSTGMAAAERLALFQGVPERPVTPSIELEPLEIPGAFEREATATDRAAEQNPKVAEAIRVVTSDDSSVPDSWKPGRAASGVRVLLSRLGQQDRMIFGTRTIKGRLCLGLTDFTTGCYEGLPKNVPLTHTVGDPDRDAALDGLIVWGLVSSKVEAVSIVLAGQSYPAVLGNNVYFFQADGSRSLKEIEAVEASLKDGRVQRVDLSVPQVSLAPPLSSSSRP